MEILFLLVLVIPVLLFLNYSMVHYESKNNFTSNSTLTDPNSNLISKPKTINSTPASLSISQYNLMRKSLVTSGKTSKADRDIQKSVQLNLFYDLIDSQDTTPKHQSHSPSSSHTSHSHSHSSHNHSSSHHSSSHYDYGHSHGSDDDGGGDD
jgi:hypothetical protein